MTYAQLYRQCRRKLTNDTADFDLSQLFHAQFSPSGQMQRSEAEVSAEEAFIFQQKVRRLAEGYPLQYLLGEWEFYSIPLKIGEGVLIPRPDTETLVDAALELLSGTRAAGHRGLLRRQRRDFVGARPAFCRMPRSMPSNFQHRPSPICMPMSMQQRAENGCISSRRMSSTAPLCPLCRLLIC